MLDQIFEMSRKTLESSLQMQQAVFKHWTQDLPSMTPAAAVMSADWGGAMRKRWVELVLEGFNRHRETLDATYKSMIQTVEKILRIPEARSTEDAMRAIEEVWKSVFDAAKAHSEAQFREFQSWTERAVDVARKATDGQS
jgi:hypothetical protein